MCGLSRLLLPAVMVGILVTSITGSAAAGWALAAAVAAALYLVGRRRLGAGCSLPPVNARPFDGLVRPKDAEADGEPPRRPSRQS